VNRIPLRCGIAPTRSKPLLKVKTLAAAAKAALEAGLNEQAKTYAEEALALAADGSLNDPPSPSFEADAKGDATAIGNLVLGRLALLHDDVESAEKYLLLSGQITDGPATFWGPNMTLARELLKRHRTEVVLQFLDEAAHFWREPPWAAR